MSLDSKRLMMDNFLSVIEGQKLDKKLSPEVYYCKQKKLNAINMFGMQVKQDQVLPKMIFFFAIFDDFLDFCSVFTLSIHT